MKTIDELLDWCEGAERQFGDASVPTGLVFVRLQQTFFPGPDLTARAAGGLLYLDLVGEENGEELPVRISPTGPELGEDGALHAFGISQVAPSLWHLVPSLNIPGVVHVFVVLYDVPTPAPWESADHLIVGVRA